MILIDKHINAGHRAHTLLLTFDEALLQFLILDKQGKPLWAYGQSVESDLDVNHLDVLLNQFKQALKSKFDQSDFERVLIGINSSLYTLVPKPLDQLDDKRKYFDQIGYLSPRDEILCDPIDDAHACLYYSVHADFKQSLIRLFPQAEFTHYVSCFLNNKVHSDRDYLLAHVMQNKVAYFIYKKGQLYQVSTFMMDVKDDFLYYINMLYRMHDLDRESAELILTGQIYPDASMVSEMRNYIRLIGFQDMLNPEEQEVWSSLDRPAHYFYDFQLLRRCA